MPRNIYVCFALMLLAACNANGLQSVGSIRADQLASTNGTIAADSKENSKITKRELTISFDVKKPHKNNAVRFT